VLTLDRNGSDCVNRLLAPCDEKIYRYVGAFWLLHRLFLRYRRRRGRPQLDHSRWGRLLCCVGLRRQVAPRLAGPNETRLHFGPQAVSLFLP